MKILFITSVFYPNEPGGAELQTRRIVMHMTSQAEVTVLCFDSSTGKSFVEKSDGYRIIRLYILGLSELLLKKTGKRVPLGKLRLLTISQSPFIWIRIKKEFLHYSEMINEPDIIHYSNSLNSISHSKLLKFVNRNYKSAVKVLTFHDFFFLGRRSKYPNKKIPLVSSYKQKLLIKNIDLFLTPSEFVRKIVIKDLKTEENRIYRIFNSTDNIAYKEKQSSFSFPLKIIYAGSIEYAKGIDTLIRVFINLLDRYNNKIKLIIAGDGSYIPDMKILLSSVSSGSYELFPWMTFNDLRKILESSDIFVLPSRYNETFGMGLIDAFNSGCLPMGSDRGAIPEILNYDTDLIFNSEDDLYNKLEKFILNPPLLHNKYFTLKGSMQRFSSENILMEYSRFYQNILKSSFRK